MIAKALAEVILVDGRVSGREILFFNSIASAMELTSAGSRGGCSRHTDGYADVHVRIPAG